MTTGQAAQKSTATFAGGCFWCMESPYDKLPGVISVTSGYTGGTKVSPTYEDVCTGKTGHFEAVEIVFDPTKTSFDKLLDVFWRNIDPTDPHGQFADKGSQYRTAIFYHSEEQQKQAETSKEKLDKSGKFPKPIVTMILPAATFYKAEEYHQGYCRRNPIRYNSYRIGSGRAGYLEKMWGKQPDH